MESQKNEGERLPVNRSTRPNGGGLMEDLRQIVEGKAPWAIISPMRSALDSSANDFRLHTFKADLEYLNLQEYKELRGYGQEEEGSISVETSYLISNINLQTALKLMKTYDQYGIIYKGPETANRIILFDHDHPQGSDLGNFHPNKTDEDQYWSEYQGKPFTFKSSLLR